MSVEILLTGILTVTFLREKKAGSIKLLNFKFLNIHIVAETKYIFVTGGVASSLGKGIISSSIGKLLQARGYSVTIQKFDPYINIDPGT